MPHRNVAVLRDATLAKTPANVVGLDRRLVSPMLVAGVRYGTKRTAPLTLQAC